MSDEIAWARKVFDAATPGPWRVDADRQISAGGYVSLDDKNADTIALLGSVRGELLAVVEAVSRRHEPCDEHPPWSVAGRACVACQADRMREATITNSVDTLHTAIQTHRERTET